MTEPRDVYTHGHHEAVLRSHLTRDVANSAAYLAAHLTPGTTLLDVGCGPGSLAVDLARRVAPGRVMAIDVSVDVVDKARAYAAEAGVDNVEFVVGDFREADLGGGGFDVVHAHQVLQHLRDPVGALAGMADLVRPGGVVAVRDADYSAMTWSPASEGLDRWLAIYLAVTQRNGAEANAGRHLLGWARQAGLDDVRYTTSTWTYATADERAWWADTWAERTVSSRLADQAVDYGIASPTDLAAIAEAWRSWALSPDGVFVVLHGEVLAWV